MIFSNKTLLMPVLLSAITGCNNNDGAPGIVAEPPSTEELATLLYLPEIDNCGVIEITKYLGRTNPFEQRLTDETLTVGAKPAVELLIHPDNATASIDFDVDDQQVSYACQTIRHALGTSGFDVWQGPKSMYTYGYEDQHFYHTPSITFYLQHNGAYAWQAWNDMGRPSTANAALYRAEFSMKSLDDDPNSIPNPISVRSVELDIYCESSMETQYVWFSQIPGYDDTHCEFNDAFQNTVCLGVAVLPESIQRCEFSGNNIEFPDNAGAFVYANLNGKIERFEEGFNLIIDTIEVIPF
ncbi:MAG: hypothetical protein AAGB12_06625 [Pseudomonadota bacterium]